MIPTKTYPLSAIMGKEITDKERIKELADAFNRACDENADFVAESIKADRRIAELAAQLKHAEGHAAELEAELTMRREQAEGLQNQWVKDTQKIVALEAEVMEFRSRGNVAMSSWDEERERALREGERVVALETDVKDLHADIARLTTEAYTREAEVKTLREYGVGLVNFLEEIFYAISIDKNCSERTRTAAATLEQRIKTAREGK